MKRLHLAVCLIMLALMTGLSELLNLPDVIFPEIMALTIGAWLLPKQPWQTTKGKLWGLMSLSSLFGMCMARISFMPVFIKVIVAFCFTALCLSVSKTTLYPMISACILPILLHTTSWIYPICVTFFSGIIIAVQNVLECYEWRHKTLYIPYHVSSKENFFFWLKRLLLVMVVALPACLFKQFFFIAPPLIVAFIELCQSKSGARKVPVKVILLMTLSAAFGMAAALCHTQLGIPLTLCSLLSAGLTFGLMKKFALYMPPAGAIAILPMILPAHKLLLFPLEAGIGISTFVLLALVCFPAKKAPAKSAHTAEEAA